MRPILWAGARFADGGFPSAQRYSLKHYRFLIGWMVENLTVFLFQQDSPRCNACLSGVMKYAYNTMTCHDSSDGTKMLIMSYERGLFFHAV